MSKKLLALLFIVACAAPLMTCAEIEDQDGVLVLTKDNFDEAIANHEYVLVKFYAPWCGHCKNMAPAYAAAAKKTVNLEPPVYLAKVDATQHGELAQKFGVKGYPTLKFFNNGSPMDYEGGRTEDTIINWVKKKTGPSSVELKSVEDAEKLIKDNKVVSIFFGDASSAGFELHDKVSKQLEDVIFGHTFDAAVKEHYKPVGEQVLFKAFDEGRQDYEGEATVEALKSWIDTNSLPTIMDFDQKSAQKIFGEGVACLFLFANDGDANIPVFQAVSSKLKGKILMSLTQVSKGLGKRLGDYIGVKESDLPSIRIVHPAGGEIKKFILEGQITEDKVLQFFEDFKAGNLKPTLKSAEIPAEPFDEGVRVLVGKNFAEVVMDASKSVLVEFYAPWCGHCKSLAPIYSELAKKVKSFENIVIAKMDATENEVEGVGIQGFPTIKYFPKGSSEKSPVDYNGGRTVDDFIKFLTEKGDLKEGATKEEL